MSWHFEQLLVSTVGFSLANMNIVIESRVANG